MAKTTLIDDGAAVVLLAATVKQCRKDLVRKAVRPEHRLTAIDLFLTIGGYEDGTRDETASNRSGAAVRATPGRSGAGAAAARALPAPVAIRRIRRQ